MAPRDTASSQIGKEQKSTPPRFDHAAPAPDAKAHAVPAGAEKATPKGTPNSDRHEMETVHADDKAGSGEPA